MNRWAPLLAAADDHRGVVTLAMGARHAIPERTLRHRAGAEGWTHITHGAWLLPGAPDTPLARAQAHLLLLGERACLSHWSAAHLLGLSPDPPPRTQLLVPAERRPTGRDGALVRRSRTLLVSDILEVQGLRATTVSRTLRDLAPLVTWDRMYDLMTDAEQRRMTTLDELLTIGDRLNRGPGGRLFRDVVNQRREDRSDSGLERHTVTHLRAAGFQPAPGPFPIQTREGILRLDIAFPPVWFALECDGFGFHRDRRSFERDRQRWRLAQQAGWRLGWVTRRRLRNDLAGIIEEVAEAHRTADLSRPLPRAAA